MSGPTPPTQNGNRRTPGYAGGPASLANLSSERIQQLLVLGYITGVVMPPVGFVIGLLLRLRLAKPDAGRGTWVMALSVIAAIVWVVALATGLFNPNTTGTTN